MSLRSLQVVISASAVLDAVSWSPVYPSLTYSAPAYYTPAAYSVPAYHHAPADYSVPSPYSFEYSVNDPYTYDIKSQNEYSDGNGYVKGSYSLFGGWWFNPHRRVHRRRLQRFQRRRQERRRLQNPIVLGTGLLGTRVQGSVQCSGLQTGLMMKKRPSRHRLAWYVLSLVIYFHF